jgi:hypothetical protein
VAERSSARIEAFTAAIDRYFALGWIGFYFLLPTSGWSGVMFRSWYDQRLYLTSLRETLTMGHSAAVSDNIVGPAYIAAARLVHEVIRLTPQDSLVLLSRMSYVLSIAGGLVLVRVGLRALAAAPPLVTLSGQFAFAGLAFAAGTWHWSDVPWTHFFTAALAIGILVARFAWNSRQAARGALIGALVALLFLTRTFEFAALIAAWGIAAVLLAGLPRYAPQRARLAEVISGTASFLVVLGAVYAATGKRGLFVLYGSNLDQLSAHVDKSQVASTPTFSFGLLPTKLVQLFVDPCFRAVCSIADYQDPGTQLLPPQVAQAGNYRLWSQPLAVQLPSLVLLPACIAVCAVLVVRAYRNPNVGSPRRTLRLPLELTIAAIGLVIGYTANTLSGSPHLRYGLARDFILPAILVGIVGVVLITWAIWRALSVTGRSAFFAEAGLVFTSVLLAGLVVATTAYARLHGIPRIRSKQLASVTYTASCAEPTRCRIALQATTVQHRPASIPEASTLTFECDGARRYSVYASRLDQPIDLEEPCGNARLVAAWPTVMGLPPGSFELAAVKVRNT